jgi:glutathione S-transferase
MLSPMSAKLYVILGSHACRTGMLMLQHKGIEYKLVELPTGLHPMLLRLRGFAGNPAPFRRLDRPHRMLGMIDRMGTVPALVIDGQRIKTNREIARFIDELQPDPPLYPPDPDLRRAVEEAVLWGDDVFQMTARRLGLSALVHGPDALIERGGDGRLGPMLFRRPTVRWVGTRMIGRFIFDADERADSDLMEALPGMLDRIDGWIEAGVLNGDQLYAADFVIAPSLALLSYRRDLRDEIAQRPGVRLIDRLLPEPAAVAERYPSLPATAVS